MSKLGILRVPITIQINVFLYHDGLMKEIISKPLPKSKIYRSFDNYCTCTTLRW